LFTAPALRRGLLLVPPPPANHGHPKGNAGSEKSGAPGGIWTRDLRLFGSGYQAVAITRLCCPASDQLQGTGAGGAGATGVFANSYFNFYQHL